MSVCSGLLREGEEGRKVRGKRISVFRCHVLRNEDLLIRLKKKRSMVNLGGSEVKFRREHYFEKLRKITRKDFGEKCSKTKL